LFKKLASYCDKNSKLVATTVNLWLREYAKELDEQAYKEREEQAKNEEKERLRQKENDERKNLRLQKAKLFVQIMQNKS
jgi:hypothetical protein